MIIGKNIIELFNCEQNSEYIYYKSNEQTRVKSRGGGSLYKLDCRNEINNELDYEDEIEINLVNSSSDDD